MATREPVVLYCYEDLQMVVQDSREDDDHLLLLGPARNGKTRNFKRVYRDKWLEKEDDGRMPVAWLQGRETAASLYVDLYRNRKEHTLIANDLELARNMDQLLKQVMESRGERAIRWGIRTVIKDGKNVIPKQFLSAVRLIIVGNALPSETPNWSAVVGRTAYYHFFPGLDAQIRYCRTWVQDVEVMRMLTALVEKHPDAISIDLDQVDRASRQKQRSQLVLSDGVKLWEETLQRSLVFGTDSQHVSDMDRLLTKWRDRLDDHEVSLSQLCEFMGWRKDRLLPAVELAITARKVERTTPERRSKGKGRQPETAFRLVA